MHAPVPLKQIRALPGGIALEDESAAIDMIASSTIIAHIKCLQNFVAIKPLIKLIEGMGCRDTIIIHQDLSNVMLQPRNVVDGKAHCEEEIEKSTLDDRCESGQRAVLAMQPVRRMMMLTRPLPAAGSSSRLEAVACSSETSRPSREPGGRRRRANFFEQYYCGVPHLDGHNICITG